MAAPVTSPIAEAAVKAKAAADTAEQARLNQVRQARIGEVRQQLTSFFGEHLNAASLSYTYVGEPGSGSVVADDGTRGVAVDAQGDVWVARPEGDGWKTTGAPVRSLLELATALAAG